MTYLSSVHPNNNKDKPDWNLGYTTRSHLCLDLDNTSIGKVYSLALLIIENYHDVGSALILVSSQPSLKQKVNYPPLSMPTIHTARHNYHVVFNNKIPYERSCHIIETLAYLDIINKEYIRIRSMRNDMTLRISKTVNMDYTKPAPVPVCFVINPYSIEQSDMIFVYFRFLMAAQGR